MPLPSRTRITGLVPSYNPNNSTPNMIRRFRAMTPVLDRPGISTQPDAALDAGGGSAVTRPLTPLARTMPALGDNMGGTMTRNGVTTRVPPSPYAPSVAGTPNAGGTMQVTGGPVVNVAPSASTVKPKTPPPQTEARNPLTGASTTQAPDTTEDVNPAGALGFSQRGVSVPRGQDAQDTEDEAAGGVLAGSGLYARRFKSKGAGDIYGDFVRRLFQPSDAA